MSSKSRLSLMDSPKPSGDEGSLSLLAVVLAVKKDCMLNKSRRSKIGKRRAELFRNGALLDRAASVAEI